MTCQSSPCIWRWTLIIIHYPNTSNNIPVQRCQWGNSETDKQWLYHDSISAHKPLILGTWWCKTSMWLAYKWVLLVLDNAMLKLQNRTTGIPVGIGAYRWRVHASALSKLRICHRGVMSCKVIKKRCDSCSNSKKIMSLEPTCEKEDSQKDGQQRWEEWYTNLHIMQDLYVTTLLHVWPMNKCVCDKEVPVPDEYRCYDESLMMWPAVPYGQPKYHHPAWSCSIHQRELHLLQRVQILPGDPACIHLLIQMTLEFLQSPAYWGW